eukprot:gnl/MRDRNA2_/MRDRNA2_71450_c0_seq1.p1 gnl/MRDRNA2_/MRDRNA2_71450_c0~~gnl/MRDRNA2_/MRDRNA2_71450_c0_seq1.p1  ORF type:complete len:452 (+),score=46.30 gnl/MRDRNA2_/MRDRNA2_71450_c0_seq1:40-1356(+)
MSDVSYTGTQKKMKMNKALRSTCVLCQIGLLPSALACPDETWIAARAKKAHTPVCYKSFGERNRQQCIDSCSRHGASLPCVRNKEENALLAGSFSGDIMLGVHEGTLAKLEQQGCVDSCRRLAAHLNLSFTEISEQRGALGAPEGCIKYTHHSHLHKAFKTPGIHRHVMTSVAGVVYVRSCKNHPNCGTTRCNGCEALFVPKEGSCANALPKYFSDHHGAVHGTSLDARLLSEEIEDYDNAPSSSWANSCSSEFRNWDLDNLASANGSCAAIASNAEGLWHRKDCSREVTCVCEWRDRSQQLAQFVHDHTQYMVRVCISLGVLMLTAFGIAMLIRRFQRKSNIKTNEQGKEHFLESIHADFTVSVPEPSLCSRDEWLVAVPTPCIVGMPVHNHCASPYKPVVGMPVGPVGPCRGASSDPDEYASRLRFMLNASMKSAH